MQMSLLDIAVKRSGEAPESSDISDKRTLIFVGSKSAGKSTMIQRLLEKSEAVKETLALEYSFGRKSGRSLGKDVCHVWELGGGTLFAPLLSTLLGGNTKESVLVVVLDLSAPKTLWHTMETLVQLVYTHINKSKDDALEKAAWARVASDHEDKEAISPFPIPLVLVGGKYDLYVNLDPEEKKMIARSLRLVAHTLAASLFFYSDKDPSLVKKLKDLLNHYGFGGAPWKGLSVDVNKPLCVPCGADSFAQISVNIVPVRAPSGFALDRFKHPFTALFPQEEEKNTITDDPAKDLNFKEPIIDQLRFSKDEELDRLLSEKENKKRLAAK